MVAFITSYWFLTLPGVLTGLYLLNVLKRAQEQKEKTEKAPVTIVKRDS